MADWLSYGYEDQKQAKVDEQKNLLAKAAGLIDDLPTGAQKFVESLQEWFKDKGKLTVSQVITLREILDRDYANDPAFRKRE